MAGNAMVVMHVERIVSICMAIEPGVGHHWVQRPPKPGQESVVVNQSTSPLSCMAVVVVGPGAVVCKTQAAALLMIEVWQA